MTPEAALDIAAKVAAIYPLCRKSQRGVTIFHPDSGDSIYAVNGPPKGFRCDGSAACRASCRDVAVHAEARAILYAGERGFQLRKGWELLHVKVADGALVPSGPPSCVRCSALILESGIAKVWLLHEDGLRAYHAVEFHRLSLEYHGLPAVTIESPPASKSCACDNPDRWACGVAALRAEGLSRRGPCGCSCHGDAR